jgi:hypothetical protein
VRLAEAGTIVAPLLLASAALVLHEATVAPVVPVARGARPEEVLPPPLPAPTLLDVDRRFRIDPDTSRAFLSAGAGEIEELRVEGTLAHHDGGEWRSLELTLTPRAGAEREPIVLQGFDAPSRPSGVPGISQVELRVRVSSPGRLVETVFSAAWLRLPWGAVRMQAVAELGPSFRGGGASIDGWLRPRRPATLALELALEEAR